MNNGMEHLHLVSEFNPNRHWFLEIPFIEEANFLSYDWDISALLPEYISAERNLGNISK
jgi:hypothetical protein